MTNVFQWTTSIGVWWISVAGLFLVGLGIYKFAKDYLPW